MPWFGIPFWHGAAGDALILGTVPVWAGAMLGIVFLAYFCILGACLGHWAEVDSGQGGGGILAGCCLKGGPSARLAKEPGPELDTERYARC